MVHLRLTSEGERRLSQAVQLLETERQALRQAFAHLEAVDLEPLAPTR